MCIRDSDLGLAGARERARHADEGEHREQRSHQAENEQGESDAESGSCPEAEAAPEVALRRRPGWGVGGGLSLIHI